MDIILSCENIKREFKVGNETVQVLKGVSLTIRKGTLNILRGRSGSGKTTLINQLGALDMPNSGKIVFKGSDITGLSDPQRDEVRRKHMGFVFQSVALISTMTAYENVEFGMRIAGVEAEVRKLRAHECLNLVGLDVRMHHRPDELSGGEQQRVAIARAIAHSPEIIFADEPTAELDSRMGIQIVKLFCDLVEKENQTIVMTTHDPSIMEVADRIFTLEDGEIIDER